MTKNPTPLELPPEETPDDVAEALAQDSAQTAQDDGADPQSALDKIALSEEEISARLAHLDEDLVDAPPAPRHAHADQPRVAASAGGYTAYTARAAQTRQAESGHAMHAYKKTMFPVLLVMGGVMALVSVVCMVLLAGIGRKSIRMATGQMVLFLAVSIVLSGVLFVGAWLFHRDTNK